MSSNSRVNKIEKKLLVGKNQANIEYLISLIVPKDLSFEDTLKPLGYNGAWSNLTFNVMKGKKYLGQSTVKEKPHVGEYLKNTYLRVQSDIKNNPNAGAALLWIVLLEKENQELSLKNEV